MCGIIGIIGTKGRGITQQHYDAFFKAWDKAETRGTDACGLVIAYKDKLKWWKDNVPASAAITYVQKKIVPWEEGITFMLGHTRFATDGDPEENGNNHPIVVKNEKWGTTLLGIHNGMIWNKEALYKEYENNFQPENQVDSEVAFRLIDYYGFQSLKPFKKLTGSFNLAYASTQDVRSFYLVRHNNPLSLQRGKDYLAFGSMLYYWNGLNGKDEYVADDTWMKISPEGEIKKSFAPPARKWDDKNRWGYWSEAEGRWISPNDNDSCRSSSHYRQRYNPTTRQWEWNDIPKKDENETAIDAETQKVIGYDTHDATSGDAQEDPPKHFDEVMEQSINDDGKPHFEWPTEESKP